MKHFVIITLSLLLASEAFAWGKSRRSSRSYFKSSRKSSSPLWRRTKKPSRTRAWKKPNKVSKKILKKPTVTKKPVVTKTKVQKSRPLVSKTIPKTTVINRTTVVNQNVSRGGESMLGSVASAYLNYKIMEMIFNPKTGKMECPRGSLLDTERNVCVQQMAESQTQAALPTTQQTQAIPVSNKAPDSDTIN